MALHPVGPLPASTYWRRRLVLLIGLLVLVLLAKSCVGGGSDKPAAGAGHPSTSPTPQVTRSASPHPTTLPTRAAIGACPDGVLQVTTHPDAATYPSGSTAHLTVTVTNTSSTACRRDLSAVSTLIYSGNDRIWSSSDCGPKNPVPQRMTLGAHASLQSTVSWAGTRSARGCPTPQPKAKPGTYRVYSRVGTLQGSAAVFRVTA